MNTEAWSTGSGFESSELGLLLYAALVGVALLVAAKTILSLYESVTHGQMPAGKAVISATQIVAVVVLLIVAFMP